MGGCMRRFARIMVGTGYGPFLAWCCAALPLSAAIIASAPFVGAGAVIRLTFYATAASAAFACLAAFAVSLRELAFLRTLGQIASAVAGFAAFCIVAVVALVAGKAIALATPSGGSAVRRVGVPDGAGGTAFTVEYRPTHVLLAEYDKCIEFPSGRRICVWSDTGGAGDFAVYRLPTGEYHLVDGLDHDFIRSDYRVDAAREAVEIMCGGEWVEIPRRARKVVSKGGGGGGGVRGHIEYKTASGRVEFAEGGEPVGDSLNGRAFVGCVSPKGRFRPGAGGGDED